jgi:hypothetical protein
MNYEICKKTGILKQIKIKPISYSSEYVKNRYDKYGQLPNYMSYLRLGYLIGTIGPNIHSLCDVGYGNGAFLNVCKNANIRKLYGVDISGYPLSSDILQYKEIPLDIKFDVVCFFDSLEHFQDIEFLKQIKTDYLYISYPECHYYNDMKIFMKWKHRRPNEHIYHFNRFSLTNYLNELNYICIADSDIEDTIRKSDILPLNNITSLIFQKI